MINNKFRYFMLLLVLILPSTISSCMSKSTEEANSDLYIDPNYTDSLNQTFRSVSTLPVGVAVNTYLLRNNQQYRNIVAHHFSSLTPENVMKMANLVPLEGTYDWSEADLLVDFSEQMDTLVHGHTLVWHNQLPSWVDVFSGSSEDWTILLKNHIQTVIGRYKGRVQSWDVVNEAVLNDGSGYRNTIWFEKLGSDYIANAFRWAHEADPDAKLFYNDYGLSANSPKLDFVVSMITSLIAEGVPIHGIGFQMHITNEWPSLNQIQGAIDKIEEIDLELKITELDISMNSLKAHSSLTSVLAQEQKERYFNIVSLVLQSS
ncbi:MAG: endo-1,4-beta-xylanase, partial [Candidatus Hodarchaeales archaeon]